MAVRNILKTIMVITLYFFFLAETVRLHAAVESISLETTNPIKCELGKPCESAKPITLKQEETTPYPFPSLPCGNKTCPPGEFCYNYQPGECKAIKDYYCGGGGLENTYPLKQCESGDNCLPILEGSSRDLPRICTAVSQGVSGKLELKKISQDSENPLYLKETESLEVTSKVKLEKDEKNQLRVAAEEKKVPQSAILNPEQISTKITGKLNKIKLDIFCEQNGSCKPVYDVSLTNSRKLMGVVPLSYEVNQLIDATNAEKIKESQPWFIHYFPFLFR